MLKRIYHYELCKLRWNDHNIDCLKKAVNIGIDQDFYFNQLTNLNENTYQAFDRVYNYLTRKDYNHEYNNHNKYR